MGELKAPWTRDQVIALNESQFKYSMYIHPFTCGRHNFPNGDHPRLVATPTGWVCPMEMCDYTQDWAWEFMLETGQVFADGKGLFG